MTLLSRIHTLERAARTLEPTPAVRKKVREKVVAYAETFLDSLGTGKAFNSSGDTGQGLLLSPIRESGLPIEKALRLIQKHVDAPALNPASGGHLGYIPGGGLYYASLGDYLADVTNRYAGVFFAGPGAVRMENMLLRWVAKFLGYPGTAAGNITSGGSIANLIAICTARDAKGITSERIPSSVIYLTEQAHHSLAKAIRIAGLGECILRTVPMDARFRMDAVALERQVKADKSKNLSPFLLIASAGTTDTGSIDPLDILGTLAAKYRMWYHVDAAYGGFFALTREGKKKLHGMEKSDSMVIDPHKGLFLPYGIGMILVKSRKQLNATHFYQANYMQDALADLEEPSPADLSPELTKHFRGLRMWLPLKLHGVKPFRACLEEKLLLTKYFYQEVKKLGFEAGPEPELSVVTYRYVPPKGNANLFNKKLLHAVQKDGRVFISSTLLDGKFTLRFACLSFRTHLSTVDTLLAVLKREVEKLSGV
ncbi:MAG: aminotransferase class I/II-fold pyridoxal phosphate-dependent enzyme [Cytophagales bacterium]|nr:aminotransferase class I/II-fold pyridoxal phosphate-dependent enzyme [Cytophagales bacterium]